MAQATYVKGKWPPKLEVILLSSLTIGRLIDAQVIPTVIDDFKPLIGIDASWNSHSAKLGNTLDPEDLQSSPSIHFKHLKADSTLNLDAGVTHVLALTDPDAPSRDNPKWSEFCHWLATSNPSDSSDLQLKDIVEYKPPGPPPKTGKHRYVFLVLVPANGTTEKLHLAKPSDRKHWGSDKEEHGVRQWADEHDLVPVGKFN